MGGNAEVSPHVACSFRSRLDERHIQVAPPIQSEPVRLREEVPLLSHGVPRWETGEHEPTARSYMVAARRRGAGLRGGRETDRISRLRKPLPAAGRFFQPLGSTPPKWFDLTSKQFLARECSVRPNPLTSNHLSESRAWRYYRCIVAYASLFRIKLQQFPFNEENAGRCRIQKQGNV